MNLNSHRTLLITLLLSATPAFASPCEGDAIAVPEGTTLPAIEAKAATGNAHAQALTGLAYLRGKGVEHDTQKALSRLEKSAAAGDSDGQYQLGNYYFEVAKSDDDYRRAALNLGKSEAQGCVPARFYLGVMLSRGELGVPKDSAKGIRMIREAAEADYPMAQVWLGDMLISGKEVDKDEKAGLEWVRKAARKDYSPALIMLAGIYWDGVVTKPDPEGAIVLYEHAYELNDNNSPAVAFVLGRIYMEGKGVAKDDSKAFPWLAIAAHNGVPHSEETLKTLIKRMPKQKLSKACGVYMERAFETNGTKAHVQAEANETILRLWVQDSIAMVYFLERRLEGYVSKECLKTP